MMNSIKAACYHCASSILPRDLIQTELGGVQRQFCCPGCMAIAQTIHGEGLEVFYTRRAQTNDKPAAYLASNEIPEKLKPYDDPSLRGRFIFGVLSGDVLTGAALMLAFGLGTLPNLLLISKFSALLTQFGQYASVRYFAVLLLFSAGGFGLYRAWVLPEALLKGGFCIT